ncbi:MAG: hypothetical protein H6718_16190 [Polyangiaceae bacterium]|nr:hypothetical protein [Myxococcales bacterium]MCB9586939.1 hypothetical protein [Polyangiaceae bacterium]
MLPKALQTVGTYEVSVNADAKSELCTVSIKSIGASKRLGDVKTAPSTQAATSCKLIHVVEFADDGSLDSFWTEGTPRSIHVRVSRDGEVYGDGTATPDYTGDECGVVQPDVRL